MQGGGLVPQHACIDAQTGAPYSASIHLFGPLPSDDVLMGMPDLQGGAQAICGVQQDRDLLAAQMAFDHRTSHLALIDNTGGVDCLTLAIPAPTPHL